MLLRDLSSRKARRLLKKALEFMRSDKYLDESCFILHEHDVVKNTFSDEKGIITREDKTKTVYKYLRFSIETLGKSLGKNPPEDKTDSRFTETHWRPYIILNQLYIKKKSRIDVQDSLAIGFDHFNAEHRQALDKLIIVFDEIGQQKHMILTDPKLVPGGPIPLESNMYIQRIADNDLDREVQQPRNIISIKGPPQSGKSSLLLRGCNLARKYKAQVVEIDLDPVSQISLSSLNSFLYYLAQGLPTNTLRKGYDLENAWSEYLSAQDNFTQLLEEQILSHVSTYFVLAIDKADRLLSTAFCDDFFAMIRGWYNLGARNTPFRKLNVVMTISTEPRLLITNPDTSPFNIKPTIYLEDFDLQQVGELNKRLGSPLNVNELKYLYHLLNGHPYLTHLALYKLHHNEEWAWADFEEAVMTDLRLFDGHLHYLLKLVWGDKRLVNALNSLDVIPNDKTAFDRLTQAGIIVRKGRTFEYRCPLYKLYFESRV